MYSETGSGTTFKIYLPRVASTRGRRKSPTPERCKELSRNRNHASGGGRSHGPLLARWYLEKQGYRVLEAADGAVAMQIAVAHEAPIQLLVTDVIMPGMNGRELAQRISQIRPNVKIVYMSGYTENVIGENGTLDAGVRLLQKPFNLRDLKTKVREVLDATPTPPEVVMSLQSVEPQSAVRASQTPASRAQRFQLHLPCVIAGLAKPTGTWAPPKTSAVPACSSRRTKRCNPTLNWKSIWFCRGNCRPLCTEVVCRGEVVRTMERARRHDESRSRRADSAIPLPARTIAESVEWRRVLWIMGKAAERPPFNFCWNIGCSGRWP